MTFVVDVNIFFEINKKNKKNTYQKLLRFSI